MPLKLPIKKNPPKLVGKQYFDPVTKKRVKKDGSPIAKKSSEAKKASKVARPVKKRIVKIEATNTRPVADAALKQIEAGIQKLLLHEAPLVKDPKKKKKKSGEAPKKKKKSGQKDKNGNDLTPYQKWYKKFVKTPAYAILKVSYPDQASRMKQVGEAWKDSDEWRPRVSDGL